MDPMGLEFGMVIFEHDVPNISRPTTRRPDNPKVVGCDKVNLTIGGG